MGKKSRRTKAKTSDFQKVKLKVGKKLPKGLNETVATFKSRSIQIKEQLKNKDLSDQPTTKRKLNLQDLLTQCVHYSPKVRHEAAVGLKELLSANTYVINENLATIIERVSFLLVDKDVAVRSALARLLKLVFSQTSFTQLAPFSPLISAQLCCAMTHLAEEIKQDSLAVLDICLDHVPEMIASSPRVLTSFLQLISRPGSNGNKRSLLSNPASKLSAAKWRSQVLQRLQRLLDALLSIYTDKDTILKPVEASWKEDAMSGITIPSSSWFGSQGSVGWTLRGSGGQGSVGKEAELRSSVQSMKPLLEECEMADQKQGGDTLPQDCLDRVDKLLMILEK